MHGHQSKGLFSDWGKNMQDREQRQALESPHQDLVARTLGGDQSAFAELVDEYQSAVYNLCYRMLGQAHDAEDAAQEAFVRAYRQLATYEPGRPFKTWLFAIACHECIDQLRKRRVTWFDIDEPPLVYHPALRETAVGPEDATILGEQRMSMQSLLAGLSPRDRSMIAMRYWEDLSYQEIAEATGDSVDAVKSRLHRARSALGAMLESTAREHGASTVPPIRSPRHAQRPGPQPKPIGNVAMTSLS